jgi:hypothetical protein
VKMSRSCFAFEYTETWGSSYSRPPIICLENWLVAGAYGCSISIMIAPRVLDGYLEFTSSSG